MPTDRQVLLAAYSNFNARDLDAVLALMHEDVDWPNAIDGVRVHGHQGVREYWTRQWAMIDPHVEPVDFRTDDSGRITVTVHQVVRSLEGNLLLDQMVEHIYQIENGSIRRMDIGGDAG